MNSADDKRGECSRLARVLLEQERPQDGDPDTLDKLSRKLARAVLSAVPEVDASQRTSKGGLTDPGADKEHSDVLKRLDDKISKYERVRGSQHAGIEETLLRDARDAIRR